MKVAIALFCYRRVDIQATLDSIINANRLCNLEIFAFVDFYSKEIQDQIVQELKKYRIKIETYPVRQGLRGNVIRSVEYLFYSGYDAVIGIEDDLILHNEFVNWIVDKLYVHRYDMKIGSVSGYNMYNGIHNMPEIYNVDVKNNIIGQYRFMSLGWGIWQNRWDSFQELAMPKRLKWKDQYSMMKIGTDLPSIYKKNIKRKHSWAIELAYFHYKNKLYCILPIYNLVYHAVLSQGENVKSKYSFYYHFRNALFSLFQNYKKGQGV